MPSIPVIEFSEKHAYAAGAIREKEAKKEPSIVIYRTFAPGSFLMCSQVMAKPLEPALEGFTRIDDFEGFAHFYSKTVKDHDLRDRLKKLGAPIERREWNSTTLIAIPIE